MNNITGHYCFSVNDKVIISRSCHFEMENATDSDCMNEKMPSYVKIQFCKTCLTDGCNGKAMNPSIENDYTAVGNENTIDVANSSDINSLI